MEYTSVKAVFDDECRDVVIDTHFVKRIQTYFFNLIHRTSDGVAFWGGNLTGVNPIRFRDEDKDEWFDSIIESNESLLSDQVKQLPSINTDFIISSDTMNLSCVWVAHAISQSKLLTKEQKHIGMINTLLVLQFKFFTSRYYMHFRYPADKAIAQAVYEQMSYKSMIKQLGSWAAVFNARAEDIISETSIHAKAIYQMTDDVLVVRMLNDVQGRLREMLKTIYDLHLRVKREGVRINSISAIVEHEGVEILRDQTNAVVEAKRYLNSILSDKASFVREELVSVIEKMMHTMPVRLFRESLEYMSDNHRFASAKEIEEIINLVLLHAFDYLHQNRTLVRNNKDLPGLLSKLRGSLMSSRSTDETLINIRDKLEAMVNRATGNKSPSILAAVRTGVYLYIVLRSLTKQHYSN